MALRVRYVFGEAWSVARSGRRQTAMAVTLVALALYVPGLLALVSHNLGRLAATPNDPVAAVLTLAPSADARALAERIARERRVAVVRIVGPSAALERFRRSYPDLGAALAQLKEAPFPPTIEVVLRRGASPGTGLRIASAARTWPGVDTAESEEESGRKFRDAIRLLRATAAFLGALLSAAAVLSVASAIRLALDLHRDEIEIMRLMGATERAIRAPFWLYAAAEGFAGGLAALGLLYGTYRAAGAWLAREPNPVVGLLWARFLEVPTALAIPLVGTAAGFLGSLLSLSRTRPKP